MLFIHATFYKIKIDLNSFKDYTVERNLPPLDPRSVLLPRRLRQI